MTDAAWARGMTELLCLPAQDETPERKAIRGVVYRRELGHLTDEAWFYVVSEAIRNERWFPTVAALLDYASRAPQEPSRLALPDDTRTPEEKREDAKKGLDMVKAAYEERIATLPPRPVVSLPPPPLAWSDERLDELRQQREQIIAEEAAKA